MCNYCNDTGTVCKEIGVGVMEIAPCPGNHTHNIKNHHDELERFREDWNEKTRKS